MISAKSQLDIRTHSPAVMLTVLNLKCQKITSPKWRPGTLAIGAAYSNELSKYNYVFNFKHNSLPMLFDVLFSLKI